MNETLKESLAWLIVAIICGAIGGGMMFVVTSAIKQAKIMACFDYKKTEVCEEIMR